MLCFLLIKSSFFHFRSDPGEIIFRILKDAKIDVEKMKEELLPEDGEIVLKCSRGCCNVIAFFMQPESLLQCCNYCKT